MTDFSYVGYNKGGSKVSAKIQANSEWEARAKLRMQGVRVVSLGLAGSRPAGDIDVIKVVRNLLGIKETKRKKIRLGDLVVFTKQMSTLIDAGITVVAALDMLAQQASNPTVKHVLETTREQVESGKEFDKALERFPDIFDTTYCSLIRAGASSGQLDTMLKKLSTYIEKSNKLRKQLMAALSYPIIVFFLAIIMTVGMLMFVVPMFAKNYQDSGKPLPGLTQFVVDMSTQLQANFIYLVVAVVMASIAFARWRETPKGERSFHLFLLKLPVFGPLITKIAIARFTGSMSTLVSSGISLPEALKICGRASGNRIIEEEVMKVEEGVTRGKSLSDMLTKSGLFPKMVSGMIGVGEQSGQLDTMLEKIALIYEEDVESALAAALKMIEPIMFVLVGGIVGFILLAMYLPIFDMASTAL